MSTKETEDDGLVDVVFYNVTLTVRAKDPKAAYDKLCTGFGTYIEEWFTDTYSVGDDETQRDTEELFPNDINAKETEC